MNQQGARGPLDELTSGLLGHLRRSLGGGVAYREPLRPLTGGFVTDVYSFRLDGAADGWQGALVLRVYPPGTDAASVRRERCAQEVVSAQGVPAPRVLACEDTATSLPRPFMIMERLPGRPQLVIAFPQILVEGHRLLSLPGRHAAALAMVHALDAAPLLRAFENAGIDRRAAGPEHWLDFAGATIARWGLDDLRPALDWLTAHRPPEPRRHAICHGDLFGANILEQGRWVTGIIDWNLVTVADPAFDLGGQIAAYEMSPMPGPRGAQLAAIGFGKLLARGLRRAYGRLRKIPEESIRYYAVMRAFTELTFKLGLQAEVRATGRSRRMPTWRPDQCARYIARRAGVVVETARYERP